MAITYHFRSDDPVFKTPEERRAYALRTLTAHPVCAQCGQRHAPKVAPKTSTTPEQRRALTVPSPPKPEPKPVVRKTHEEWCKHYGVPDWKRQVDAPPSLLDALRAHRGGQR